MTSTGRCIARPARQAEK